MKIQDVLVLKRGYDLPESKRINGQYLIYSSNGIAGSHNEYKVKGPAVITGRSGSLGTVQYTENNCWPLNTTLYVSDFKGNNPKYISYLLQMLHLEKYGSGSAVPTLNRNHLDNLEVTFHSLIEQQHIVDIIGSLDDKIENNNKIIEKLQRKIDFIFNQFYTNILESDIFIKCKLKEYAKKIITGTTPSTKEDKYWGNSIDFITIPDMQNNVYVLDTIRKLSTECEKSFNNRIVPQNSIAISCIATVGLVTIIPHNAITNQQINSVIFNDENDCYYFYELFKTMKENLIQLGSGGSATLNINKNIFSNIEVIVPYKNEMEQFCKKTNSLFELILSLTKENTKLDDLKQLYLKKFFG